MNIKMDYFGFFFIFTFFFTFAAFAGFLEKEVFFDKSDLSFDILEGYDVVKLQGCTSSTVKIGAPFLPRASFSLLIPQGAEVTSIEVISVDKEEISGEYNIYPTQHPQPFLKGRIFPFVEPDSDIYAQNTSYPEKIIESSQTGSMGGYRLAGLLVCPLQYIPDENKLIFHSRIKFRVTYEEKLRSLKTKTEKQNEIFRKRIQNLILNPEDIAIYEPSIGLSSSRALTTDTVEYVIITVDSFASAFQELADWKTKKGVPAKVITLDYIYANYTGEDNAEMVRNFIKDANSSWGTIWVLLGGQCDYEWGQEIVPRRNVWYINSYVGYYTDEDTIPTDLYFSDLDGDWNADGDNVYGESTDGVDLYSDVFVGRAPVRTVLQAETFVNKIFTYEKSPPPGYQKKILLPAAIMWTYYDESLSQEAIANMIPGNWQVSRMYERNGELTRTAFVDSVHSGFGFAHLVGHGDEYGVYTYYEDAYFNSDDLDASSNGSLLGIHNSIACMSGALDLVPYGDCFAEHFLTPSTGGGFSIMNSRYGWGTPPAMGPSEHIDTCFYHEIFREDYTYHDHVGVAHAFSKDGYVSEVNWYSSWAWCIYELNLFGDPEMPLWTDDSGELVVTHDAATPIGSSSLTVNVNDGGFGVEGALVCIYKDGEVYERGYTDMSGRLTLTLSPPPNALGTMYCTVTKNNYIPYEGNIEIISPDDAWIVFEEYTLNDNSGNDDGNVDPGEVIEISLTVHNVGLDDASGITGILRTDDPYVILTDSTDNFGDVMAGSLAECLENFDFDVSLECPANHIIDFELVANDIDDNTWNSHFAVPVLTPDIALPLDTIDFDTVYIGYPDTFELIVENVGGDILRVNSIKSDNGDYIVDNTNFNLPPYEAETIGVIFSPVSSGMSIGDLSIFSNDSDESILTVSVEGEGFLPPEIEVSPDSLSDSLYTGERSHHNLTIYNNGESLLNFNLIVEGLFEFMSSSIEKRQDKSKNEEVKYEDPSFQLAPESYTLKPDEKAPEIFASAISVSRKFASSLILRDDFEDGDYEGWLEAGTSGVKEVTNSTAADGTNYSYHEYSSPAGHFDGIYQSLGVVQPGYVGFYIRSASTTTSDCYFVLSSSSGSDIIWFFAREGGYFYVNLDVGGDQSFVYEADTWYHIEFKNIDFSAKSFDYYVNEDLVKAGVPFRSAAYANDFSRVDMYNYTSGSEGWWDEILIAENESIWMDFEYTSGSILSGDSALVGFYFDADGLYGGDYTANVNVYSNDPDESEIRIPAYLKVTGTPDIAVSEDTMDFDIVYIGYNKVDTLIISNVGSDSLTVSDIYSNNSDFSVDVTNFTLDPEESQNVVITLTPSSLGGVTGVLTVISDDWDESNLEVALQGQCLEPPDISVSPGFLSDSLFTGETSVHNLKINNTGNSDLIFYVSSEEVDILRPTGSPRASGEKNIAVLGSDVYDTLYIDNIVEYLEVSGRFASVSKINGYESTPTLAELQEFDAVGVFGWNSWHDPSGVGDVLADYIDSGGNVLIAFAANGIGGGWLVEGRFDSENYWLINASDYDGGSPYSMGTVYDASHSIMQGVDTLISYSKLNYTTSVREDATLLAEFQDGTPLIAINETVNNYRVDISFTMFTNEATGWGVDPNSDAKLLIINAFEWMVSGVSWLDPDPTCDTVQAGDSVMLDVVFDATGLFGGNYYANLIIRSNDPDNGEINVPTHLNVTGAPNISVSKDTVDFGVVFEGYSATDTLVITNSGTDLLTVSDMTFDNPDYTVDINDFVLEPGEVQEILVTLTPSSLATINGLLSIESDDPDSPTVEIYLRGICLQPPDISVSPNSLSDTLYAGEASTHTLTIYNTGASYLNFNITMETFTSAVESRNVNFKTTDFKNNVAANSDQNSGTDDILRAAFSKRIYESSSSILAFEHVLVMERGPASYHYDEALDNLGLSRTLVNTWDDLFEELNDGTQWELVIINSYGNTPSLEILDSLDSYQQNGGFLIYADWSINEYSTHPLLTGLGIDFVSDFLTPLNFYPVDTGHQLFNNPNEIASFMWTDNQYNIDGEIVVVLGGAVQLAHFEGYPDYGAIVLNEQGNCLFNAFQAMNFNGDYDFDGKLDIVELIENEIMFLSLRWLAVDPESDSVFVDDSLDIEVTFDAANLVDGDYFADIIINSNDPDESKVIVPGHLYVLSSPGVEEDKMPEVFFVKQNYPNPFSRQTVISYGCPKKSHVCIQLFDLMGRVVNTLIDEEVQAGYYEIKWDGTNKFGRKLPNSVYFYRMLVDKSNFMEIKKMILLQ